MAIQSEMRVLKVTFKLLPPKRFELAILSCYGNYSIVHVPGNERAVFWFCFRIK